MRIWAVCFAAMLATRAFAAVPAHCTFPFAGGTFTGSCGPLFGDNPVFRLRETPSAPAGSWRMDLHPLRVWSGDLTDSDGASAAMLEEYDGAWGILRTEYGWFSVSNIVAGERLSLDLDATREIRPNDLDRRIVERAAAILSSSAAWNRADNRVCPATAAKWSIYCAMDKATIDISGGHDHRRPAMEVVRAIVDDRTADRKYDHRLMDYNNDPTTTLADVQSLFHEALADMNDPAWLTKHDFATGFQP